jgi:hypothetical protein
MLRGNQALVGADVPTLNVRSRRRGEGADYHLSMIHG